MNKIEQHRITQYPIHIYTGDECIVSTAKQLKESIPVQNSPSAYIAQSLEQRYARNRGRQYRE